MEFIKNIVKALPPIKKVLQQRDRYKSETERLQNVLANLTLTNEELNLRVRNSKNLIATLYGKEEYYSDIVVDGSYRHVATFTLQVGCPIRCRYCPQSVFVKAYKTQPNFVPTMTLEKFKLALSKISKNTIVSFTGFTDNFVHPDCLKMIQYTLDSGYKTRVFSTLYNVTIEDYCGFAHHPNLTTLDVHLPDCQDNTIFPMTSEYKALLRYVVENKPKYATFWTSCLGIDGGVNASIKDIIKVNPNPVNSIQGLVYDNYLDHGTVDLSCKRDCSRLDFPKAGVGAILPNGDVVGCTQDWELKHIIGNIFSDESFDAILEGSARQNFKNALTDPSIPSICRKCELASRINAGTKLE